VSVDRQLPPEWRTWRVHELRAWLRASPYQTMPYLDYAKKARLIEWIEKTCNGQYSAIELEARSRSRSAANPDYLTRTNYGRVVRVRGLLKV
jgi:hypothetical protein